MPSPERRAEIETVVSDIVAKNEVRYSNFDITKFLTQKYGFKVGVQNLDKNTTGLLIVDDDAFVPNTDTHRLIVVNRDLGVKNEFIYNMKKRFIIAHEFAHFILHKKDHVQFAHRDTDNKGSSEEKEADYFARCLLMPDKLIRKILSVDDIKNQELSEKASIVSKLFFVTEKKATERIKELGLS